MKTEGDRQTDKERRGEGGREASCRSIRRAHDKENHTIQAPDFPSSACAQPAPPSFRNTVTVTGGRGQERARTEEGRGAGGVDVPYNKGEASEAEGVQGEVGRQGREPVHASMRADASHELLQSRAERGARGALPDRADLRPQHLPRFGKKRRT